ncbi:DNA polymerase III subunit gamma and tau, partial [Streptomyces seoulensis]|uniref:DNA polymerase III subunit gamma and tau n=1 Tax=Streptomyces seoulensis TaxID=73044 RepID=UPI0033B9C364
MSSLALYRRYRPETFAEVIGQEHVTDPLQQALRNNRVNHAYLFSGPRGCGKTTSARILARCLNCEQGPTPTPCGECQSCQDLARNGPGSIDVIEIDAASHGGVDDARELREKAFFGPASSRYKIYIIDEAHMVTSAGFNALLKVVEEPPEHLKFIFATTEPEKVIGTIRSRTHHYPFRLVPPGTLREYLGEVCQKEAIPVAEGVLPLVVRAGQGSVRDSMSVMDQLLAGAGADGVTYPMATSLLGYTDGSLLDSVVEAFATGDGAAAFEVVDHVIEGGNDPRRFVADLLERLRDLVILAAVPDAAEKGLIDAPADVLERMQAQAEIFGAAELSRAADLVNEGLTEMRGANSPRLQLELICARVMLPAAYGDERSVMARLDRIERGVNFSAGTGAPPMQYVPAPDAHPGAVAPTEAPVAPGGGPAAARAAVRNPGGPGAGTAPASAPAPTPARALHAPPPPQPPT